MSDSFKRCMYFFVGCGMFFPVASAQLALLAGGVMAIVLGNPDQDRFQEYSIVLLKVAVIGLGAGIPISVIRDYGASGLFLTFIVIFTTFIVGFGISRFLKLKGDLPRLITIGTAICGGSAIAAVAPILKSRSQQISMALAVIFIWNAVGLILFPALGRLLYLSEAQFGLWAALSIHDTGSVIGTAITYGREAVDIAVPLKLIRTIWIIPLVFFIQYWMWKKDAMQTPEIKKSAIKIPWFICGVVLVMLLFNYGPENITIYGDEIVKFSKRLLVVCLFFIGATLSVGAIKKTGGVAFLYGGIIWSIMSVFTFYLSAYFI